MTERSTFFAREFFFAVVLMAVSCLAEAQSPPTAPATSPGNYQVTWQFQGAITYLEEKVGASGTWLTVSNTLYQTSGGNYFVTRSKPAGEYFYRLNIMYTTYYGGSYWIYSSEIRVLVTSGPLPGQDLVTNQLRYAYSVRTGDINADGRTDVFIQRTAGGTAGNGTLDNLILRRLADGTFAGDVPTSAQVSTASGWPSSATPVKLTDINLDGFVDVILPGLGSLISGAVGQIVFSPGVPGVLVPQSVVAMDAKYTKFINNTVAWNNSPNYFEANAPLYYQPVYSYIWTCGYRWGNDYYYYDCWLDWGIVGYQAYYDFSNFDPDSVNMRYAVDEVINGIMDAILIPGSGDSQVFDQAFRNVFRSTLMRALLNGPCYDYDYDPITRLPCAQLKAIVRAILLTILNLLEDPNARYLTVGEKVEAVAQGLDIVGVDLVRVHNSGYKIIGNFWTMSPDGDVWVGSWQGRGGLPYSSDYSVGSLDYFGVLIHELTHVYQSRTVGCNVPCMATAATVAAVGRGYDYYPFDPIGFAQHNIEQQGEMVMDRMRFRKGLSTVYNPGWNGGVKCSELNNIIPFGKVPACFP